MRRLRRPGSRPGRVALAAGAGLLGDLLLLLALWVGGAALSRAAYPLGGGSLGMGVLLAIGVFSAGVLGGTLPALALGSDPVRALGTSLAGHLCGVAFVFGALVPLRPFDGWPAYLGAELALAATVAGALWTTGGPRRWIAVVGVALLAASLALGGFVYGLPSVALALLPWSLLPALTAILARGRRASASP